MSPGERARFGAGFFFHHAICDFRQLAVARSAFAGQLEAGGDGAKFVAVPAADGQRVAESLVFLAVHVGHVHTLCQVAPPQLPSCELAVMPSCALAPHLLCPRRPPNGAAPDEQHSALAQQLMQRIVDLEDENRALRGDLVTLSSSYTAAMSKNNLFQAKILELQARIDVGQNPSMAQAPVTARYRSPLVQTESGALTYRFEKHSARDQRPLSARQPRLPSARHRPAPHHGTGASGAVTARDHVSAQRPPGVSKLLIRAKDGALTARPAGSSKGQRVATASSNPRSVDRLFREHRRSSQLEPAQPASAAAAAAAADEEAAAAALRVLEEDASEGRVTKTTPLTLNIVYCIDTAQRSQAAKIKPERYRELAADLRDAVAVTFEGWNVSVGLHELAYHQHSADERARQLGCFEVTLLWSSGSEARSALLHSKVRTRAFPDIFDLLSNLLQILSVSAGREADGSVTRREEADDREEEEAGETGEIQDTQSALAEESAGNPERCELRTSSGTGSPPPGAGQSGTGGGADGGSVLTAESASGDGTRTSNGGDAGGDGGGG